MTAGMGRRGEEELEKKRKMRESHQKKEVEKCRWEGRERLSSIKKKGSSLGGKLELREEGSN